jgi:hypothetical protein
MLCPMTMGGADSAAAARCNDASALAVSTKVVEL